MTVRGFMVEDSFAETECGDAELAFYEWDFRRQNDHVDCGICHSNGWAATAFVWPRNGFPPGLDAVVQSV